MRARAHLDKKADRIRLGGQACELPQAPVQQRKERESGARKDGEQAGQRTSPSARSRRAPSSASRRGTRTCRP